MQPNTITLAVNEDNDDGTTPAVDKDYSRYEEYLNRSTYISEDHVLGASDTLKLYRSLPKPSGNFRGVAKTSVKFSKDFEVDGVDSSTSLTAPLIFECSFSIPVGVLTANVVEMRQRLVTLLCDDEIMNNLNLIQMI